MPNFDIVKTTKIEKTYRVARIMSDYDVKTEHANEQFIGELNFPKEWNIGVIVGGSGTGKTTIAKHLFSDHLITKFEWVSASVIDDMLKECNINKIERMFYAVGFGSVPSWLKPFSVLSNGEKMRVELARSLLERDFVVFDEFTSVVDRKVAQTASLAISKAIKNTNKKFIAITCHYDILEWLQPDWVFDTNEMKSFFMTARALKKSFKYESASEKNGKSLGDIII